MVGGGAAAPEAVLAEAVVVAALALVAQTGERVATASLARHRVIHCPTHTDTQLLARWPGTLSDFIRDPTKSTDRFRRLLKTFLFTRY